MAQYLVLIYEDEMAYASATEAELTQVMVDHNAFSEGAGKALLGGNALQPTMTATSIRKDSDGGFVVTDGAFAETKEALGGYYLVEAADLDEALALAKAVPAARGGVEVRPIMTFD
ncbi:MAG TPA: YciI family protein [Candidatus Nanopelagicales bacterium]|jgi:hypothetical protein